MLCVASCNHKELCDHHPHTARVRIDADWSKFDKDNPTGMTVMVYPQDGSNAVQHLTNDITHAIVDLPAGRYNSVVFNQSETEYGTVSFRGMDKYETAEVYTNTTKSSWYKTKDADERVVTSPEWIGASRHENAEVTPKMVETTGMEILAKPKSKAVTDFVIANHTPRNIVFTITVTVHIKGFHNLRSSRASLDGLAEGYLFGKGVQTNNKVTQLLEEWRSTVDGTDPTKGTITSTITCFGLPYSHAAQPDENLFKLAILLVDNKTIMNYTFQVGDKFVYEVNDDVEVGVRVGLSLNLELSIDDPLPDVEPEGGSGSGFNATVDDWGDEENYEIEM